MWPTLRLFFVSSLQPGLISATTILILSGVLFGMGLGQHVNVELCFTFGAVGVLSYSALNFSRLLQLRRQQERRADVLCGSAVQQYGESRLQCVTQAPCTKTTTANDVQAEAN